jgi:hypothetical protein
MHDVDKENAKFKYLFVGKVTVEEEMKPKRNLDGGWVELYVRYHQVERR